MNSRVYWIDAVKFIAVLMVVLAHVIWIFEQGGGRTGGLSDTFLTINRMVASLGVPLFMMVSGALLLGKKFETMSDVLAFYRKGLLPLFVTAEIWVVVYSFLNIRPFSVKELLLCMTFVHKPEVHLWYVRMIVGYYLMLPLLSVLMHRRKASFVCLTCMVVAFTFLHNGWLILDGSNCPTSSSRSYFCYLVYMVLGYAVAKSSVTKMIVWILAAFAILGGGILYHSLMNNSYFLWYDNPMLAVVAVGLFGLLKAGFIRVKQCQAVVEVSKMSYGIYLSHFLLVYLAERLLEDRSCGIPVFYLGWVVILLLDAVVVFGVKLGSTGMAKILFRY